MRLSRSRQGVRDSIEAMSSRTIYQVLAQTAARHGARVALYQPHLSQGRRVYETCTWDEYRRAAEEIAAGLATLGVRKGDTAALASETRAEFYLADLGVLTRGAIAAALYTSYPPADLVRSVRQCGARVLFVEDAKMREALRDAPAEHVIVLTGEAQGALPLEELRRRGREAIQANPGFLGAILAEYGPADDAVLYLTSGATGEPKMALVTHQAIVSNLEMGPQVAPLGPDDCTVAWLPAAHIAQRVGIEFLLILTATPTYFAESLLKLPQEIKSVRPTFFLAPPRMWERVYTSLSAEINKRPRWLRTVLYGALGLGLEAARRRAAGHRTPMAVTAALKAADALLFRKIRERFGGRLKMPVSGAAPLGKELAAFYDAIGMPLIEGYGLTEGGIVALNPVSAPRIGSIGKALPGVKFSLAEDGELLIEGPTLFSRYLNDPEATAQVLRDGVLHTGDIAHIDEEGFVYITGRKKEMIVASNGKKVFPARVENLFKLEPLIGHVLLIGDRLPYMTAVFTLNPQVAESLPGMESFRGKPLAELARATPVVKEVQRVVKRVNAQLAPFEQIRKYRVLDRDFTIEAGELTATMKLRRSRAIDNLRAEINELYAGHETA